MAQVRYITIIGGTPKVVPVDNLSGSPSNIAVRTAATTVEFCLEDPQDAVAPNTFTPAVGPAPTWLAAPAAVSGVVTFPFPISALRFSNATDTTATVLQQGLR